MKQMFDISEKLITKQPDEALERWANPQANIAWEDRLTWFKSSPEYRALDKIDGEPTEFEWNIFPGFTTLQLHRKVQEFLSRLGDTPENLLDGLFSCRCSTTSHGDQGTTGKSANQVLSSFLSMQRDLEQDNGHSSGLDQRKSGTLFAKTVHKGERDRMAEKIMLTFAGSTHPVFRSPSPLPRGVLRIKGGGKLSIHYCADPGTIETVFAQLFL